MVYETIAGRSDVDLSGTELEAAETSLFREAVAESIRATMWLGDTERNGQLATFDGFVKRLLADSGPGENDVPCFYLPENFAGNSETDAAEKVFKKLWEDAPEVLKAFKPQGNLVYLVTSDIYARYEEELDNVVLESAYLAKQNGREALSYRGIPVIDIQVTPYLKTCGDMPQTFALLTDRRNLAIAVNTADFPGTEIRMWYNPDQMENRQRAIFMAGCDYLLPEMVSMAVGGIDASGGAVSITVKGYRAVNSLTAQGLANDDSPVGEAVPLTGEQGVFGGTLTGSGIVKIRCTVTYLNGESGEFIIQ